MAYISPMPRRRLRLLSAGPAGLVGLVGLAALVGLAGLESAACSKSDAVPPSSAATVSVRMQFERASDFYSAPFPSDDLLSSDGRVHLDRFPNETGIAVVKQATTMIEADAHGFALGGGAFFGLTGAVDARTFPDLAGSVGKDASVFLVGIDEASPDFGQRKPVTVAFEADAGPFGSTNLLSVLPLQGAPLRPKTRYAAVVRTSVHDASGAALAPSAEMSALAGGTAPKGMSAAVHAEYASALQSLGKQGVPASEVVGLAVFTTDAPTAAMPIVRDDALGKTLPTPTPLVATGEVFDSFCVFSGTIVMPDYQEGTPPYSTSGGGWKFDAAGKPIAQAGQSAEIFVTIPRSPMPKSGYPLVNFIRTGGGGDRPLIDRGPQAVTGGPALKPGTGPAMHFGAVGWAGVSIDPPLEGPRNPSTINEDFAIFNVANAVALRDNIRESALETALVPHIMKNVTLDVSSCPGASGDLDPSGKPIARFDPAHVALMGHSMGAWIAPQGFAIEPAYEAMILSGAGGSWLANVMYKVKPLDVRPVMEVLLGYTNFDLHLTPHDPALTVIQWALEPSDPMMVGRTILREPPAGTHARHVLMEQGIVDHYLLPDIANALSMPLGLDLAGPPLDASSKELQDLGQYTLESMLPYSGRKQIPLPASGNFTGSDGTVVTAVVVQHPEDGVEDGHEIVFQTEAPKHQYRCFLASLLKGVPTVPVDGAADAPCP